MYGMEVSSAEGLVLVATYEYKCEKCEQLYTLQREIDKRDDAVLCDCGWGATRIFSAPAIKFNGTGFYSTGG